MSSIFGNENMDGYSRYKVTYKPKYGDDGTVKVSFILAKTEEDAKKQAEKSLLIVLNLEKQEDDARHN